MMMSLHTLASTPTAAKLPHRITSYDHRVRRRDPAVDVMTDFTREMPVTVSEEQSIDTTLVEMIRFGIRAMLVVRGHSVVGFITSYDIEGEKPMQFLQSSTYTRHHEIQVGDIMTPLSAVVAFNWQKVQRANIEDVLEIFHHVDATHILVMETVDSVPFIRGLFSRTQIERQLMTEPMLHQRAI
jgi:CBS domain-containing protein